MGDNNTVRQMQIQTSCVPVKMPDGSITVQIQSFTIGAPNEVGLVNGSLWIQRGVDPKVVAAGIQECFAKIFGGIVVPGDEAMSKLIEIEKRDKEWPDELNASTEPAEVDRRYLLGLVKEMRKGLIELQFGAYAPWYNDEAQSGTYKRISALLAKLEQP